MKARDPLHDLAVMLMRAALRQQQPAARERQTQQAAPRPRTAEIIRLADRRPRG